jgi:hypothetical protein
VEISLENLTVGQVDLPPALLRVPHKHPLVKLPIIVEKFEVCEVEGTDERHRTVIVDLSQTVEFILRPTSLIGQFSALVIQSPLSVHFVAFPLTLVVPSILVVKFSSPVTHAAAFVPLVSTASLVLFYHIFLLKSLLRDLGMQGRVLVSHFDYRGIEFVFSCWTDRRVWGLSTRLGN